MQQYVAVKDDKSVHERLHTLQLNLETLRPQILHDPYEIETIRLWSEALTSADEREGDQ
jgi:hypothetical protein